VEWLNYHHLLYFWVTAREGGLTKGAAKLRLTHSTLSTQIHSLEEFLGGELFRRQGRVLVLTPLGVDIARYADEIFHMGAELVEMARGRATKLRSVLRVGVVGALPKTVAYRLLEPALSGSEYGPIIVRQDSYERLLDDLGMSRLHLVLSDQPPPEGLHSRAFGHMLGETEIVIYGTRSLARKYRDGFPQSLSGAPMLLPAAGTNLRRLLERWLTEKEVHVQVEGEFDDAAMMRAFGVNGRGLFPVRAALAAEVEDGHGAVRVGVIDGVRERYYAVSTERRARHPAMVALLASARERLLAPEPHRKRKKRKPVR
jgi:LysR family transcriptional activator of nhaA